MNEYCECPSTDCFSGSNKVVGGKVICGSCGRQRQGGFKLHAKPLISFQDERELLRGALERFHGRCATDRDFEEEAIYLVRQVQPWLPSRGPHDTPVRR